MEIGKKEAPKTRYTTDGSVEWRCSKCALFKPLAQFNKTDDRRGYVCEACNSLDRAGHRNTDSFILAPLLSAPCKPVNLQNWERAIWRHIREYLAPFKFGQRSKILGAIKAGRESAFKQHRRALMDLLASEDKMLSSEYFWLVFRRGLLDIQSLRLYAIGVAKYAAKLSGLYEQDSRVENVLFEVRHVALAQEGHMYQTRQIAYDVLTTLEEGGYSPPSMYKAAMALTAICFPDSYEAALAATGWTVETWLAKQNMLVQTGDNAADREKSIAAILTDLRKLLGVMAQAWGEDRADEARKAAARFTNEVPDYDAIEDG